MAADKESSQKENREETCSDSQRLATDRSLPIRGNYGDQA